MPTYATDSKRQPMSATGIVNAVMEWEKNAEGKRVRTDRQERDPDTGMLKWDVEVLYTGSSFGQESTITANVTVGCADKPNPAPLTPIRFEGLSVSVWVNKANGIAERWEAEAITDMQARSDKATNGSSTAASAKPASSSASAA